MATVAAMVAEEMAGGRIGAAVDAAGVVGRAAADLGRTAGAQGEVTAVALRRFRCRVPGQTTASESR